MKKLVKIIQKKPIIAGMILGLVLTSPITVGAMSINVWGELTTENPVWSAPKGKATTTGRKKIVAKCTAEKNGVTRTERVEKNGGGSVKTGWVFGPTYKSAGTKFKSVHTGYSHAGKYQALTKHKMY